MLPFGVTGTHVRNATHAETGRATALDAVAGSNRVSRVFVPATNRVAVGCESASNRDPARLAGAGGRRPENPAGRGDVSAAAVTRPRQEGEPAI